MTETHLTDLFKEIARYLGLTAFESSVHQDMSMAGPAFSVVLHRRLESVDLTSTSVRTINDQIDKIFDPIKEGIKNSQLVAELTAEHTDKIRKLELELAKSQLEVERLRPFETYYDLAFKLQHGKENV